MSGTWNVGPRANNQNGPSQYVPSNTRTPEIPPPRGWTWEFTAGVDEYQRMKGGRLLRIRAVGTRATRKFCAYAGAKYLGSFSTVDEAAAATMRPTQP